MATLPRLDSRCKHPEGRVSESRRAIGTQSGWTAVLVTPRYRADIDGLRAVAVICVVLFHANVPGFAGGYVGVDVFFVISGYLITQLLAKSAGAAPRAWLKQFYLRRSRRILPALLLTLAVAAVAASLWVLPWDLVAFGKFLAASSVLLGNIAGWTTGNYFNVTGSVPLTHLWSIAVEEQFYLLYPLALLLLTRYAPRHLLPAIASLTVASFTLCVWAAGHKPVANFFLPPMRAWELLLGAAVALGENPRGLPRIAREALSILAGVALALAVCLYDSQLPYPGLATLAPCLATAILITTGRGPSLLGKLLSTSPLVFTGRVSYSWYLWHLPILVLVPYYSLENPGPGTLTGLLALSYLAAVLSWRFVEQPIRHGPVLRSDRRFVTAAAAISVALFAVGIGLWASDGLPQRFARADVPHHWVRSLGECERLPLGRVVSGDLCGYGPPAEHAPRALVWGDSHAIALVPAYEQLAAVYGMHVYFAVMPSCRPLLGIQNLNLYASTRQHCRDFNLAVVRAVERLDPSLVILNARWTNLNEDLNEELVPDPGIERSPGISTFRLGLQQTLQGIDARRRSVCLVLDVPAYRYDIPHALVRARMLGSSADFLQVSRDAVLRQLRSPESDLRGLARDESLTVVDPKDVLCRSGICAFRSNGQVLYGDSHHLDTAGALLVESTLEPCFRLRPRAGLQSARRE